jgi:sugar phosphate isomerase/epimerase
LIACRFHQGGDGFLIEARHIPVESTEDVAMKLGFVSAILPDLPLSEVLAFAAETGYSCVELMCWPPSRAERRYAGVTHVDVTAFDDSAADKVRKMAEDARVEISGLGYYPNPLSPHPQEAELAVAHIRNVIRATARLGVGRMNTFVGRDWTRSVDENWPRFLEVWRPLVALAEEQGVRIGIENCPMLFSNDEWPGGKNLATSPAIWRRMFADIPSPNFGLNFDPSHCVWQHLDYLKPLREFADRLVHVHAKDVRVDRHRLDDVGILATPLQYHVPKLPGLGDVDWGQFFSVLTDVGYRGPVCVEVEDRAFEDSLEARKNSLRQSAVYLRNFVCG